jgi:DNA-binding response OmpR family regulator
MEFSLLLALVENEGRVVSALQAARLSTGRFIAEAEAAQTVKVYVRRLRQKLADAGCPPSLIVNVRGRGYIFDPDASELVRAL